jgi:hypothetical protein
MMHRYMICFISALLIVIAPLSAKSADKLPESTKDGLQLVQQNELGAVYIKPGASLKAYQRVHIVDAYVAFAKDWEKEYNRDHMRSGARITDEDMQHIKEEVAREFKKVFSEKLEKGGYVIATEAAADVMILRPAIINLEITAPDVPTSWRSATVVSEAGQLTLYAELYDSVTSAKFAEVLDAEIAGDYGIARVANRVTNRAALEQALGRWAELLVKRLDEAHGKP